MNKIDLNTYGVKELSSEEKVKIDGGIEYFEISWNYNDPTCMTAVSNGVKAICNGFIWLYNQLT